MDSKPIIQVRWKGKFDGQPVGIEEKDFDPKIHERVSDAPKAESAGVLIADDRASKAVEKAPEAPAKVAAAAKPATKAKAKAKK